MAETQESNFAQESEQQHIGTVYAKALLGATEKSGNTELALSELKSWIEDVLNQLPRLVRTLESPRVAQAEKEAMIDKALGKTASKEFVNFLKVVCDHGRFNCLRMIYRVARRLNNTAKGQIEATLITAEPVTDEVKAKVTSQLKEVLNKEIELQVTVDPTIIGGMMVRVGDTVYDGSISNQLAQIRNSAMKRAMTEIRQSMDRFLVDV